MSQSIHDAAIGERVDIATYRRAPRKRNGGRCDHATPAAGFKFNPSTRLVSTHVVEEIATDPTQQWTIDRRHDAAEERPFRLAIMRNGGI